MKRSVILFVIVCLLSCAEEDKDPDAGVGCLTAIDKEDPSDTRVTIRCCTREEFLAGSNTSAGGTSYWNSYRLHQWEKCDDCK